MIYRSNETTQNMITKLSLAIINLRENNDYTLHSDLNLKIYFDICARALNPKGDLKLNHIDAVLELMPDYVNENLLERYFPKKEFRTMTEQASISRSYRVIKFHINRYAQISEFYSLLTNKDLFAKSLSLLTKKNKTKILNKYFYCYAMDCNDNPYVKLEDDLLTKLKFKLMEELTAPQENI